VPTDALPTTAIVAVQPDGELGVDIDDGRTPPPWLT